MKFRKNWLKQFLAVGLSFSVLVGISNPGIGTLGRESASVVFAAENEGNQGSVVGATSRDAVHDGAILHAFCWNFETIKENMADIAAAGYTAVQTSPINECLDTHPALQIHGDGMWYYHYQPTDWKIGNYQLGTRDQFIAMCEEADRYGVSVIVDILPNHTTPTRDEVSQDLLDAAGGTFEDLLHKAISDTSGRIGTTYTYDGLLDVDTENIGFQEYFYEFLLDCLACGADGFRIDTAKHIALPDDPVPSEYEDADRNTFYPNMKSAIDENGLNPSGEELDFSDLFVYGETLQGNERTAAYQDMLGGTTASNYGAAIRTALSGKDFSVDKIEDYRIDDEGAYEADPNKLVTWVESHDNYCNDGEDSWKLINDEDVRLGWAIIGARADGTPLFFSRPKNSSAENPWGDNVLGASGNDEFKAPEVVAVNHFREAMAGKGEALSNPNGNVQTIMIERGDDIATAAEGAVIVNGSTSDVVLDCATKLADGTYENMVSGEDSIFTVKNGVINGVLPARSVVVLSDVSQDNATTVFFYNSENWNSVYAQADETTYPATNNGDGWWSVTIFDNEFDVTFTDGANHTSDEFGIDPSSGRYAAGTEVYESKAAGEEGIGVQLVSVYFFNAQNWESINAYAYLADGTQLFGGWPGSSVSYDGAFWYRADVKFLELKDFTIIFNHDGAQTENIAINTANLVEGTNGALEAYVALNVDQEGGDLAATVYDNMDDPEDAWGVSGRRGFTDVYFYDANDWGQVSVYTWGDVNLGDWPGRAASQEDDGWYKIRLNATPGSNVNIIFNNGNNGKQTPNLAVSDVTHRFFVGAKGDTFTSKQAASDVLLAPATVQFYNEEGWNQVYAYAEGSADENLGTWPGVAMTEQGNGWYSAEVAKDEIRNAQNGLTLTFHDNSSATTTNRVDQSVANTTNVFFAKSVQGGFTSQTALYEALNIYTRVYFYNTGSWSDVYVWAWDDEENFSGGQWPGRAATREGSSDWWYYDVYKPAAAGFNVIFNNNGTPQTDTIPITDPARVYTSAINLNTYASKSEVQRLAGETVSLADASVAAIPAIKYTGRDLKPALTVTYDGVVLTENQDYTVTYENNVNVGTGVATIVGRGSFEGTKTVRFAIQKAENEISVDKNSISVNASATKDVTVQIHASARSKGNLSFSSSDKKVKVDAKGKVTIPKNYLGSGTITISAAETANYKAASQKKVTFKVNAISNKITAKNIVTSASTKKTTVKIGAKQSGKGTLSYSSNEKSVKVDKKGKITIAKKFVGKATITIRSAASCVYKASSAKITVVVNSVKTAGFKVKKSKSDKAVVSWKKDATGGSYEIQYSTSKKFKSGVKTVKVNKNSTVNKTISLKKGKTYYVRIRTVKKVSKNTYASEWSSVKTIK